MKVLIVDDDQLVCQSFQLLLGKEADLQITHLAANGQKRLNYV